MVWNKKYYGLLFLTIVISLFLSYQKVNAANYFFNGNNSNEWHDLLNWFTDVDLTTPAEELPGPADDAYIEAHLGVVGFPVTVANLFIAQVTPADLDGSYEITVTGTTTVGSSGGAAAYIGSNVIIHGNTVFNLGTSNQGTIDGDATFNSSDSNNAVSGIITGSAIFNDSAYNEGTIETNVTFNDTTNNNAHIYPIIATFNDNSSNNSTVESSATTTFNGGSLNAGAATVTNNAEFYATSTNGGAIGGNAIFYEDSTTNSAGQQIGGVASFFGNARCDDTQLFDDANFYDNSAVICPVFGTATFYEDDSDVTYYAGDDSSMQIKIRKYASDATTTRDFIAAVSTPWTIVADGAVVNIADAVIGVAGVNTILSPINGGKFILNAPTLTTASASSLSTTGATLNGEITDTGVTVEAGAGNVDEHGFAYGTASNLSTTIATSTLGALGETTFNQSISGLTCGTTYYYRAYARNSAGTGYGSIQSFDTSACPAGAPFLSLSSVSSLTTTSVTLNASITNDGSSSSTDRGFHWGTTSSYGSVASTTGTFGVGAFSQSLSALTCATTYYYRAFAINSTGTATTTGSTFTTSDCPTVSSSSGGGSSIYPRVIINSPIIPGCPAGYTCVPKSISIPVITPTSFIRNLTIGSSGNDVKNLQQYLNAKGYTVALTGPGSSGKETNLFGGLTRLALIKFQKANKIYPSVGYFGPLTRAFITKNP
jgi:hypothetical protein